MNHLKHFESYGEKSITFKHKSNPNLIIEIDCQFGKIKKIKNDKNFRFPFSIGQSVNRSLEVWACSNNFYMNGEDTCPEKKIFGIKVSDVPKGHEWRYIFPNKFR